MKICILETDVLPDGLVQTHCGYPQMFRRWLSPALPEAQFAQMDVCAADATLPDPDAFDGYLITGSRAGVYDDLPWIPRLKGFLQDLRAAGRPVGGVCFGHQIMAEAFGGRVQKSPHGWNIGRRSFDVTKAADGLFQSDASLHALSFHQDHITDLPPDAQAILRNTASPYAGVIYDFPAISVQFHPEFHPDFVRDLVMDLRGSLLSETDVQTALSGLYEPLQAQRVAQAFAQVMRGGGPVCPG
ncbi:type 1 glutamine amidotransferase [Rhodobacteraceae bacterium KMM 6894]|nr:type 1 glutamine amidotransferase [Rhodobacteraceae bacterium KMM 6894]